MFPIFFPQKMLCNLQKKQEIRKRKVGNRHFLARKKANWSNNSNWKNHVKSGTNDFDFCTSLFLNHTFLYPKKLRKIIFFIRSPKKGWENVIFFSEAQKMNNVVFFLHRKAWIIHSLKWDPFFSPSIILFKLLFKPILFFLFRNNNICFLCFSIKIKQKSIWLGMAPFWKGWCCCERGGTRRRCINAQKYKLNYKTKMQRFWKVVWKCFA